MAENITVSRETLRAELSALELRLVDRLSEALDKKADLVTVDALESRVAGLEISRAERSHLTKDVSDASVRITRLERFRYSIPATSAIALLFAVATFVDTYFH